MSAANYRKIKYYSVSDQFSLSKLLVYHTVFINVLGNIQSFCEVDIRSKEKGKKKSDCLLALTPARLW